MYTNTADIHSLSMGCIRDSLGQNLQKKNLIQFAGKLKQFVWLQCDSPNMDDMACF
jgi:hypothetical protein